MTFAYDPSLYASAVNLAPIGLQTNPWAGNLVFAETTTGQVLNADLLAYFDQVQGEEIGTAGPFSWLYYTFTQNENVQHCG